MKQWSARAQMPFAHHADTNVLGKGAKKGRIE
jgi:hypothetical protein